MKQDIFEKKLNVLTRKYATKIQTWPDKKLDDVIKMLAEYQDEILALAKKAY